MLKIALSYRRTDSAAIAGRIFDRLVNHYGPESVFMDIDTIPFGVDFRHFIDDALREIDVLIVVIGPGWLGAMEGRSTRISDETDPVRVEVEAALRGDVSLIPVLVDHAVMPKPSELPATIADFAFRNAAEVDTGRDFHAHMDRLIRSMDRMPSRARVQIVPSEPLIPDSSDLPKVKPPAAVEHQPEPEPKPEPEPRQPEAQPEPTAYSDRTFRGFTAGSYARADGATALGDQRHRLPKVLWIVIALALASSAAFGWYAQNRRSSISAISSALATATPRVRKRAQVDTLLSTASLAPGFDRAFEKLVAYAGVNWGTSGTAAPDWKSKDVADALPGARCTMSAIATVTCTFSGRYTQRAAAAQVEKLLDVARGMTTKKFFGTVSHEYPGDEGPELCETGQLWRMVPLIRGVGPIPMKICASHDGYTKRGDLAIAVGVIVCGKYAYSDYYCAPHELNKSIR